ncbi:nucleoside-diphosphate kinase [Monocercomonoides exilis]|uniref:nucleoside-diphosphate kinase n=1 Tax=Monocercomonoides exilis TaxID=2049356 RepID=UPI00355A724B|nr:nucleoside-diphosphate kinase [Monocercomonoides exilis]|eukprot:MONOS_16836.1-p1 / transcript=MONOS_16836.1 / gene=MONOS_16836 / organism=Monocercomonoides_exilis_PA203 / gene_product=nucleoside-diphosphate kinase / transcript_product=nucleoside-diphosphate kinase / location=Mono_scaffold00397:28886-29329(-) / protein_length=148 / sequence_SO=supercontig / SO=protein_coding / is_pseudo=false
MIKPDAFANRNEILSIIRQANFTVVQSKVERLTREKASLFYEEHKGKPFYESLVEFMSSGPVLALALSQENAVSKWRALIGPTNSEVARSTAPNTIRAIYGLNGQRNAVHGSASMEDAEREINFFFGNSKRANSFLPPIMLSSKLFE